MVTVNEKQLSVDVPDQQQLQQPTAETATTGDFDKSQAPNAASQDNDGNPEEESEGESEPEEETQVNQQVIRTKQKKAKKVI